MHVNRRTIGEEMSSLEGYFTTESEPSDAKVRIVTWDEVEPVRPVAGAEARPVYGDNVSVQYGYLGPNLDIAPTHWHPEEQMTVILDGELEIETPDETWVIGKGQAVLFPPNAPHTARTRNSSCTVIEIFSPPRGGIPK
jgi:unsaturated pyranuronate lyase